MRAFLLTILIGCCIQLNGQQQYWQQQVNVTLNVTLNDQEHSLTGFETIEYHNFSPDTLRFIWIHLWPNAYINDRTAFSDQQLQNGKTDFYFSNQEQKGYINRLNFKVNGLVASMIDHPQHQDIVKVVLPNPLPPNATCIIETPFYVKIPYNFSRGGHVGQSYQITQWYPKPAVYDVDGWHEMPYLDQGEFYNNFGNYQVTIKLPANYVVAATGNLVKELIEPTLNDTIQTTNQIKKPSKKPFLFFKLPAQKEELPSATNFKSVTFVQNNVTDFAWFADKELIEQMDSVQLPSGNTIHIKLFTKKLFKKAATNSWQDAMAITKKTILERSALLGDYGYNTISVVEGAMNYAGGMEYPTITVISGGSSVKEVNEIIEHEVGHNWFQAMLATNERQFPWMDEGMNTYYDNRFFKKNAASIDSNQTNKFLQKRLPNDFAALLQLQNALTYKDQPINTSANNFNAINYALVAYYKGADFMLLLQNTLGTTLFDSCMRQYFVKYAYKHPTPDNFKQVLEEVSKKDLSAIFNLLAQKGELLKTTPTKKPVKVQSFFGFKNTHLNNYLFFAPAIGYNKYDATMLGVLLHNYTLPTKKFQFVVAPLYATGSSSFNALSRVSYNVYTKSKRQLFQLSLAFNRFTTGIFTDSNGTKNYLPVNKFVPAIKWNFISANPTSTFHSYVQWKTFFIAEKSVAFARDTILNKDNITYPIINRYINQLQFVVENTRALYPYSAIFQAEQSTGFVRLAFTGKYFFNYANGGGMQVRLFAGKFIYTTPKSILKRFEYDAFLLNMSGAKGFEDYTYSNYFVGRNDFDRFASQQIMERDGFFKVRTDLLGDKIGKTDNWLAAVNFTTDFPKAINPLQILPVKIPLKIFVDIGTYAEAWNKGAPTGKFIYDAGLQVSLCKNLINIYIPILYSKVYTDYFKSTITEKRFLKNISFSIDLQNAQLKKLFPKFAL
jgi:hypothetical protein